MVKPVSVCALLLLAGLSQPVPALPQNIAPEAAEEVKRLVAMVQCDTRIGAGIVFGHRLDTLYIATANHVVFPCRESGQAQLLLRDKPDQPTPARVSAETDSALDLAVLKVADARLRAIQLPFDRLGNPDSLARGSLVFSLGWRGRTWALSVTPEQIAENNGERIYYESNLIGPGHSGGALLSRELLIMGMLRSDQPPYGEAISIARILKRVREWGFPVQLAVPSVPEQLAALAVGGTFMCGLDATGAAFCWGGGEYGLPALGTGVSGASAKRVVGGLRFRALAAAYLLTCALTDANAAYCWGMGPDLTSSTTQVPAPKRVDTNLSFRMLSLGDTHACGITLDHAAYCWGGNGVAQLGDGTVRNSRAPVRAAANAEFATISAGDRHTCALTLDGTAFCWGQNINGEAGVGSNAMVRSPARVAGDLRFRAISASSSGHVCGVTLEGDAYCWGSNSNGELGNGDTGAGQFTPTAVAGDHKFVSIVTGWGYSCALTAAGEAYCWGLNEDGQLGTVSERNTSVPAASAGGIRFRSLHTGRFVGKLTCGISTDGSPYCWGRTDQPNMVGPGFPVDVAVRTPTRIHP